MTFKAEWTLSDAAKLFANSYQNAIGKGTVLFVIVTSVDKRIVRKVKGDIALIFRNTAAVCPDYAVECFNALLLDIQFIVRNFTALKFYCIIGYSDGIFPYAPESFGTWVSRLVTVGRKEKNASFGTVRVGYHLNTACRQFCKV